MEFKQKIFYNTPLIHAMLNKNTKIIKLLINKISVDVNCEDISIQKNF